MIRPVIFCKAPVAGRVKTRLQPEFTPGQAAEMHAAMASHVIFRTLRLYPNTWIAADHPDHPFFRGFDAVILPQGEGDLGMRMLRLTRRAFTCGARGVLLLGTDSPHISAVRLHYAVHYLKRYDVVLGPVEDGGYDLLAMRGYFEEIFHDIVWGSASVLTQTLCRISEQGLTHRRLSMGFDVDTAADFSRSRRSGWK